MNLIFSLYTEHTFIVFMKLRPLERAQWKQVIAAKPDALSSIHGTHMKV